MLTTMAMAGLLVFAFPDEVRGGLRPNPFRQRAPGTARTRAGARFPNLRCRRGGRRLPGLRLPPHAKAGVPPRSGAPTRRTESGTPTRRCSIGSRRPGAPGWPAIWPSWRIGRLSCSSANLGSPPRRGTPSMCFAGGVDGQGWAKRNEQPVYRGQDAFRLVWDDASHRLVNYQTTYQKWPKRYADNMGDSVRRVLHIRTSRDGLVWTPGGSFAVDGPPPSRGAARSPGCRRSARDRVLQAPARSARGLLGRVCLPLHPAACGSSPPLPSCRTARSSTANGG